MKNTFADIKYSKYTSVHIQNTSNIYKSILKRVIILETYVFDIMRFGLNARILIENYISNFPLET